MIPEYTVEFEAFRPGTAGIAFEKTGTTTHDGDKVTRYEATGDAEAVATVDATLFVADSGVVRYVEMDATYGETDNDVTMEITAETTAVDDATVEPPEWVPEDG